MGVDYVSHSDVIHSHSDVTDGHLSPGVHAIIPCLSPVSLGRSTLLVDNLLRWTDLPVAQRRRLTRARPLPICIGRRPVIHGITKDYATVVS